MPTTSLSLCRDGLSPPAGADRPWKVSGVMSRDGGRIRLVVNAIRDAGAAMELTSIAHDMPDLESAIALAHQSAQRLGVRAVLTLPTAPALLTGLAA